MVLEALRFVGVSDERELEYVDELPDDLNATDFVGPYLFPNNSRRRIPGLLYLLIGAASRTSSRASPKLESCPSLWSTSGSVYEVPGHAGNFPQALPTRSGIFNFPPGAVLGHGGPRIWRPDLVLEALRFVGVSDERELEYVDELPDDLNATDFVGPYLFPNNSRRRIPGLLYLLIGAACVAAWIAYRSDGSALVNGGLGLAGERSFVPRATGCT